MNPFIRDFGLLGKFLRQFQQQEKSGSGELGELNAIHFDSFETIIASDHIHNPWFTPDFVRQALGGIADMLEPGVLEQWMNAYKIDWPSDPSGELVIGIVMAANIPLVGFHDLISVLACGHRVLARASSRDDRLIKALVAVLGSIHMDWIRKITITEEPLKNLDAVIATGSNSSARHFEYYFRDIPHIIRKNRNGIAVLHGNESENELEKLGLDIFSYFGLGCRNVSKIYVPGNYDLTVFMAAMDRYVDFSQHNKYANNVAYYRSIYLLNRMDFLDNGVLLLREEQAIASPVGVVYYERYTELGSLLREIEARGEEIQCIISSSESVPDSFRPGESQRPMPWDYADGVDTLGFISKIK